MTTYKRSTLQNTYYRIYWGIGRQDGSSVLYLDGVSLPQMIDLIGTEAEAKLITAGAEPSISDITKVLSGFNKAKIYHRVLSKLKDLPAEVTLEKYEGTSFTWRKTEELVVNIPGNIAADLMVSHLLKRVERSRIYINLSCSKNAMLTVDGGRVYRVEKMDSKQFDVFWNQVEQNQLL